MFLAIKEIRKDKSRFILIIGIVVLISYLVFFLTGLAYGLAKDNTTAVENWQADKIVLKSGTNSNLSSSVLEMEALEDFESYEVSPINLSRVVAYKNSNETKENTINLVLMGLDQDSKAYPQVIEGHVPSDKDQVVGSVSLKEEEGLGLGDIIRISMNDREYEIVGFTEDVKYNVSPVVYTDLNEASPAMMAYIENNNADPGESQKSGQGQDLSSVSSATTTIPQRIGGILIHGPSDLSSNDTYDVIEIQDFILELPGYLAQVLTFGLMIGFLILISTIVLGVFMYILTMQKKQTFGVMKVQGISDSYIGRSVVNQTFLLSFSGVLIGLGLTLLSEQVLPASIPFRSNYIFYGTISLMILIISLLGAVFSVRAVSRVDPLDVLD